MAKRPPDPRQAAWLATTIARDLSPIKRANYFTRLLAWFGEKESGMRASATWPRLPLSWTRYPSLEASKRAGMPWAWWPVTNVVYRVALLETARIGPFLGEFAGFAAQAAERGALADLWAWVAWDAERAWVFVDSVQRMDGWCDGELWRRPWAEVGDLAWVEWSSLRGTLRCRWEEGGRRRDFLPDASPPPRDFGFAADDAPAMRALLAGGPMRSDPELLPDWLLRRYASGEVQIRLVPFVFEGRVCFPDDTAFG